LPATVAAGGTVQVGETAFSCASLAGLAPGSPALLCIRPEDVVVRGVGARTGNAVAARIVGMEFLGSFFRTRLAPVGAGSVELAADFSINAVRDLSLAPGVAVTVALPSDRLSVYPRAMS